MSDPAQLVEGASWGASGTAVLVLLTRVPWSRVFTFIRWVFTKRAENKTTRRTITLENDVVELRKRLDEFEDKLKKQREP